MKHLVFFIVAIFLLSACGRRQTVSIIGKVYHYQHQFLYVEVRGKIDSVEVEEGGTFVYEKQFRGPQFLKLYGHNRRDFILLLCDTTENIQLEASATSLKNTADVSGSRGTLLLRQLSQHFNRTQTQLDSLRDVYQQFLQFGYFSDAELEGLQKNIDKQYNKCVEDEKQFIINFVNKNKSSLSAMTALFQSIDAKGTPLLMTDTANIRYFLMVDSTLHKKYRFSAYTKEFRKSVRKLVADTRLNNESTAAKTFLKIGDKAPSFALRRADGEKVKLSQYNGKWVLLDFWASWCIQSRENNQTLSSLWRKYHRSGFDVLQVSLDKDVQMWQTATQHDDLPWHGQVSDLKYWESEVVMKYGVSKIPANFLISPQGEVVAINISLEKLEQRLKKIKH